MSTEPLSALRARLERRYEISEDDRFRAALSLALGDLDEVEADAARSRPEPGADLAGLRTEAGRRMLDDLAPVEAWKDGVMRATQQSVRESFTRDIAAIEAEAARGVTVSPDLATAVAAVLHRWKHPTKWMGEQGCRCMADAAMGVEVAASEGLLAALPASPAPKEPTDG